MDFNHHSHEINGGKRINGFLNGGEISDGKILGDVQCVRREKLVLGSFENRVIEGTHKIDPFHELLL